MSAPDDDGPPGVPEWVVTYGDMMSLLLTFFIMLVSMSEMKDDGKHRAMLDAIRETFGPAPVMRSGVPGRSLQKSSRYDAKSSAGIRSRDGVKKNSRDSQGGGGPHKTVERISHATVVTMGGPAMFSQFDASLNDHLKQILQRIAQVLSTKPNMLIVRGHASKEPLPADSEYENPLDLSFARAFNVYQYLVDQGIDRRRIVVSAVGDTEPRLLTREGDLRHQNRRVDVFLIDEYITRSELQQAGYQ